MGERYLADTSAVIKYLNGGLPRAGISLLDNIADENLAISFITEIELSVWNPANSDDEAVYREFIAGSTIIGISQDIIDETIHIRKNYRTKLPDALIAATAIVRKLTLIADNDKDFAKIVSLKYINPAKL